MVGQSVSQGAWRPPEDWAEWTEWLSLGLHGRCRWRLPLLLVGLLFAGGRRTVTAWLRAAGLQDRFRNYYYFISSVGRNTKAVAIRLLQLAIRHVPTGPRVLLALDDTPTKRYGPQVEGAGLHHNPTSGPGDHKFFYGHVWVTLAWVVRHPLWQTIGLPLLARLYVKRKDIVKLPSYYRWAFQTKLELGLEMVREIGGFFKGAGKMVWVVADGAYAYRRFLKPVVAVASMANARSVWPNAPASPADGSRSSACCTVERRRRSSTRRFWPPIRSWVD